MQTYKAFNSLRYSTVTQFPNSKVSPMSWVRPAHDVHKFTFNINIMKISSGIPALRYATGTLKMAKYLTSCDSMIRLVNMESKYMDEEDASSLGMYHLFGLPSTHTLPFSFPQFFPLSGFLIPVIPYFVTLWYCQGPVPPLVSCNLVGFTHSTWLLLIFSVCFYTFLGCHLRECCIHSYLRR